MVSQTLLRSVSSKISSFRSRISSSSSSSSLSSTTSFFTSTGNKFKSTAAYNDDDKHESETFLTGASSLYAEQMYLNYQQDPNSVHETWRKYFDDLDSGKDYDEMAFNRPTVVTSSLKPAADANDSHLAVSFFFGLEKHFFHKQVYLIIF